VSGHDGPVIGARAGFAVIDCRSCGWAHLEPLPDEAELALMYERSYYQEQYPGWLEKDRREQSYWDLEHADKLSDWSQMLDQDRPALLDVGCSGGLLLEYATANGWDAEGIEPSTEAVAEARSRGLAVHRGLYEEVSLPPHSFDVVHCKLVAEHLPRPRDFLGWARSLLRRGGIVSIHVPNDFNVLQLAARDALGKDDWWIAPPFHINYFKFESLEKLLYSEGAVELTRDATFPVEWFLLMGEDYVGDEERGASVHRRRMNFETRLEAVGLRRELHRHLAAQGLGREAIVHAKLAS
jgi:SAM-dependent methyltransferase